MGWGSATCVARVHKGRHDPVWEQVLALQQNSGGGEQSDAIMQRAPVCCFALQGVCYFDEWTCSYSHNMSEASSLGCHFGVNCRLGHGVDAQDFSETSRAISPVKALGGSKYVELVLRCSGPTFDDSDPLWSELACALQADEEELGDADLPYSARRRLEAEGVYHLADEESADEWLCVPADRLLEGLRAAEGRLDRARAAWLSDGMLEAEELWTVISSAISLASSGEASTAIGRAEEAVQAAFKKRPLWPPEGRKVEPARVAEVEQQWPALLANACAALEGLERSVDIKGSCDEKVGPCLQELKGWLQRCQFVAKAAGAAASLQRSDLVDASPCGSSRSRSPRRWDEARTLLEVVMEAARHGEHILVHHVVGWRPENGRIL